MLYVYIHIHIIYIYIYIYAYKDRKIDTADGYVGKICVKP